MEWLEENNKSNALIALDSLAALASIKQNYLITEIHNLLYRLYNKDVMVCFVWIPAHVVLGGNEDADILAKQSFKSQIVDMKIPLCKAEGM